MSQLSIYLSPFLISKWTIIPRTESPIKYSKDESKKHSKLFVIPLSWYVKKFSLKTDKWKKAPKIFTGNFKRWPGARNCIFEISSPGVTRLFRPVTCPADIAPQGQRECTVPGLNFWGASCNIKPQRKYMFPSSGLNVYLSRAPNRALTPHPTCLLFYARLTSSKRNGKSQWRPAGQ